MVSKITTSMFKRRHQSNFPNIEEVLSPWVENAVSDKVTLTDSILREKAKKFSIASLVWLISDRISKNKTS